jgi:hypothetical protein
MAFSEPTIYPSVLDYIIFLINIEHQLSRFIIVTQPDLVMYGVYPVFLL